MICCNQPGGILVYFVLRTAILLGITLTPAAGLTEDSGEDQHKTQKSRSPMLELAVRMGPMTSMPSPSMDFNNSFVFDWEVIHAAIGVYTEVGIFSAFYAYQTDQNACGFEFEESGNSGSSRLHSCNGSFQQLGGYYRLPLGAMGRFEPWAGFGLSAFHRAGRGTRTFTPHADCNCDAPDGLYRKRSEAEGVFTFILLGGEYAMGERIAYGVDLQVGSLDDTSLTANLGLRVGFKVY